MQHAVFLEAAAAAVRASLLFSRSRGRSRRSRSKVRTPRTPIQPLMFVEIPPSLQKTTTMKARSLAKLLSFPYPMSQICSLGVCMVVMKESRESIRPPGCILLIFPLHFHPL
ncbi:hypothetical protein DL95DRAFT_177904 [Leptodontidium sp. 2 PMI_412]|nr:hypothetical protein DL95DRAFT_177904 [Leptodontidium sp. 2 PMI_412]